MFAYLGVIFLSKRCLLKYILEMHLSNFFLNLSMRKAWLADAANILK